mgnify:CR=1 FL=1
MNQERFWILFSKKLSGELNAEEKHEFEALIQLYPEWQPSVELITDIWAQPAKTDSLEAEDAYLLHEQRLKELEGSTLLSEPPALKHTPRLRFLKYFSIASSIVIGMILVFSKTSLFTNRRDNPASNQAAENNKIYTRPGSRSKVELSDGSTVWLNSGSTITYEKNFGKNSREVTLSGEGYFDITKNKDIPFYINTDNLKIKVLGTILNVKAYPDDKKTETSLIRGKVEVIIKNRPNNKIILAPREKLIVENVISHVNRNNQLNEGGDKDSHILMSVNKISYNKEDSTIAETGWVNNRLMFRDEPFEDLLRQMERWYNVTLVLTNNRLKQKRVSGTFENETINQALDALKFSIPFEYSQTGNKIIIY